MDGETKCIVATDIKNSDVFINANKRNDCSKNSLVICSESKKGFITDASKVTSTESLPDYYANAGSILSFKLNDTLIQSTYEIAAKYSIETAQLIHIYVNYGDDNKTFLLIKCTENGYKVSYSAISIKNKNNI